MLLKCHAAENIYEILRKRVETLLFYKNLISINVNVWNRIILKIKQLFLYIFHISDVYNSYYINTLFLLYWILIKLYFYLFSEFFNTANKYRDKINSILI